MKTIEFTNASNQDVYFPRTIRAIGFDIVNPKYRVYRNVNHEIYMRVNNELHEYELPHADYSISDLVAKLTEITGFKFTYEQEGLVVDAKESEIELIYSSKSFWFAVCTLHENCVCTSEKVLGFAAMIYSPVHPTFPNHAAFLEQLKIWNVFLPKFLHEINEEVDLLLERKDKPKKFIARIQLGAPGLYGRRLFAMDRKFRHERGILRLYRANQILPHEYQAYFTYISK